MEDERKLIQELSAWVKEKETVLEEKEAVPLPEENIDELKALLDEHKVSYISSSVKTWLLCCAVPCRVFVGVSWFKFCYGGKHQMREESNNSLFRSYFYKLLSMSMS